MCVLQRARGTPLTLRAAPARRSRQRGAERVIGTGAERRDGHAPLVDKDGTTDGGTGATPGPHDGSGDGARPDADARETGPGTGHQADAADTSAASAHDGAPDRPQAPRSRRIAVLLGVAALAYVLDLVTKLIVVAKLEGEAPIDIIGDWLQFRGTRNAGAAFGIGEAYTIVFTVIAATIIVVILRLSRKLYSLPWAVALGLLLGGALGNLTDRVFRSPGFLRGHVVDFIAPKHFAVFNLADSAIVIGGCLIVLLSFLGLQPDGTREGDEEAEDDRTGAADGRGGTGDGTA